MKPRILIIVTDDPRSNSRPAEAVRIAAGAGTWKRADIALYLRGEAVRALGESPAGLIDTDDYARYWPLLAEASQSVYVQRNAGALRELGPAAIPFKEISDAQLAKLAARHTCVLRF